MAEATVWRGWFRSAEGHVMEHLTEYRTAPAFTSPTQCQGVVLGSGPGGEAPFRLDYDVLLHPSGAVRRCELRSATPAGETRLTITADGFGHWFRQGVPIMELTGCRDMMWWCSPTPSLWPLKRLNLPFGEDVVLPVIEISGPDLALHVQHLSYQSESQDRAGARFRIRWGDRDLESVLTDADGHLLAFGSRWQRLEPAVAAPQ